MLKSSESDEVYECQTCGKTFGRRTYLQLHEKIHGEKRYKCNICDKAFSQPAGLWIHKKRQSCLKRISPRESQTSAGSKQINEEKMSNTKKHECDICNRRFSQKHLLNYHKRTHTGENPYPCTICGKMFRGTVTLKYHERTHTGHKPYKCIYCAKSFTQVGSLRLHSKKEHQSDKVYECEVCMEKFEKFRKLSSHKKSHFEMQSQGTPARGAVKVERETPSNQVRGDSCQMLDECNIKTGLEVTFDSCLDSGEKDSPASGSVIYTKKEKRNSSRNSHKFLDSRCDTRVKESFVIGCRTEGENSCVSVNDERSASIIGEELKTINDEGVSSADEHTLVKPVKHKDAKENIFYCTVCHKNCRTLGALRVHERIHNGARPYKCIFCLQPFTQRSALLQHCRRIHHSDQIYECDVCKEKFEKHRDLSSHKQVHSNVPYTMAKETRMYDELKFDGTFKDEEKPMNDETSLSLFEDDMGDCDSISKNSSPGLGERSCKVPYDVYDKKHSTNPSNSIYEKLGNINSSSSDASLSIVPRVKHGEGGSDSRKEDDSEEFFERSCQDDHVKHFAKSSDNTRQEVENMDISLDQCLTANIKSEKEDYDSYDSGISPDTSPLDENVECGAREYNSIYEVSMQPINLDCEESDDWKIIGDKLAQTTGDREISLQESHNIYMNVVSECIKTISENDESSNYSRMTSPDNDYIFSGCHGNLQRNSFFDERSDTSWQFRDETPDIFTARPPDVKHQQLKDEDALKSSNNFLGKKSDRPSSSCYRSEDFEYYSTEMRPIPELSNCLDIRRLHSDVLCNDDKMLRSDMKSGTIVCEGQTSNFEKLSGNHKSFPSCECRKTLTNGTQYICFNCDVLPASSSLVR